MNNFKQSILIGLLGLLPIACAESMSGQPPWVSEPHQDYPADRFLVGVASGDSCNEAVDRAIARLSQQIEVRVNATEQRRLLVTSMAALVGADAFSFQSEIQLDSSIPLKGVEIVETTGHPSGACDARAVLDIDRSIGLYDSAITLHDAGIAASLDRADRGGSLWITLVAVSEALREAIERDELATVRGVLASKRQHGPASITLVAPTLIDRYMSLRDRISISVIPVGDCPEEILETAEAALTRFALPLEQDHPGALQLRIGWLTETTPTYDPRWWKSRWRISVTLYDAQRGETIASHAPPFGAAYGLSALAAEQEARFRAVDSVADVVGAVIRSPGAFSPRSWMGYH